MCWFRLLAVIFLAILLVFGWFGLFNSLRTIWTMNVEVVTAPISKFRATSYLQQYGYMDKYNITSASVNISVEVITSAIKDFQKFAGILETGELDDATITMMGKPRCGVKDKAGDDGFARMKRYAFQGSRWNMNNLTYRISKYPSKLQHKELVDNEIARALKVWGEVTNLKFTNNEKEHVDLVHIDIRFEQGDLDGQTLAHAFSPHCGSDVHFDDEEQWTVNEDQGINLFQVAAHEFGHALGLDHSDEPNSVMAPFYDGYDPRKKLSMDDILSIQMLYGRPGEEPASVSHHRPIGISDPRGPDLCDDPSIDALTIIDDGRAFAFKDDFYWEIEEPGIVDGPRKISEDWDGLPGNIDAAMTWTDRKTYFFKVFLMTLELHLSGVEMGKPTSLKGISIGGTITANIPLLFLITRCKSMSGRACPITSMLLYCGETKKPTSLKKTSFIDSTIRQLGWTNVCQQLTSG